MYLFSSKWYRKLHSAYTFSEHLALVVSVLGLGERREFNADLGDPIFETESDLHNFYREPCLPAIEWD